MSQLSELELDIQTKLLRATYLTNMAVMKQFMPEIFEFFQNYTPTRAKLTFDHNGELNMVSEGALVYEEHAKAVSYEQAELFFEEPKLFSYQTKFGNTKDNFEHAKVLRRMYEKRSSSLPVQNFNLLHIENQIDLLTMIGVGLGFHIERLFQLCNVRYFYLYEPDPDCFYCAMHCIDFGPLIKSCFSQGGAFTIKLGGNANQYVNGLNVLLVEQGFYNVSRFYNYRHYRSEATDETFKRIYELAYRFSSGWGFFEDEIISVVHTISNVKEKFPLLIDKTLYDNELADRPVFVVGNGPSLDDTISFIKENQNNALIFSCGTALKAILDAGIMPDFHIEMERTAALYPFIDAVGHKDKLKQINIIALNTVYPKILKLFKKAFLLSKPKDGGMDFLYEVLEEDKYTPVYSCNPTVSNAATAAAVYMGFKEMYLFGVDYGFIDASHHHSKSSIYYQKGSFVENVTIESDMEVKGNFEEFVQTTQHLDNSKATLEILLEQFPEMNCYNCSNGAYIQLTKPTKYKDIEALSEIVNKSEKIETLLENAFVFDDIAKINVDRQFKKKLASFKDVINNLISFTSVHIESRLQLAQLFSSQYKYLRTLENDRKTRVVYRFLIGTINYYQANVMSNAYFYKDKNEQIKFIVWALKEFHQHLLWLNDELVTSYDKPSKI